MARTYNWTPDQVRPLTLADVAMLAATWIEQPPICDLVHALAVWAGAVKPPSAPRKQRQSEGASLAAFKAANGEP